MFEPNIDDSGAEEGAPVRRRAPVADAEARHSVMMETDALAKKLSDATYTASATIGEYGGRGVSMGVAAMRKRQQQRYAEEGTDAERKHEEMPDSLVASLVTNQETMGSVGRSVGGVFGMSAAQMVRYFVRHAGAHQCDVCGKTHIYNYYTCQCCSNFDMCEACYSKFTNVSPELLDAVTEKKIKERNKQLSDVSRRDGTIHIVNHSFYYHNNPKFVVKSLLYAILFYYLLRIFII
eukprot:TRINITY_DN68697_c0_g1_i1.p2 TRINITY_DN68697_c0_g1~~TRINITY_DN68697_c0_g1_i1.p2  ORF type:complete len:236 (-),score=100.26 TRINITY_DN68697_c0_g1_i1:55-762(-)